MSDYSEDQGFFERIGEFLADHGRTIVSIIVVILLVGTGIYAYTRDGANQTADSVEDKIEELADQEGSDKSETEETDSSSDTSEDESQPVVNENTQDTPIDTEIVKIDEESSDITVKAGHGDGVTHLARKAIDQYITDNSIEGIEPGHRVFIETTLKNQYYQQSIDLGQEITFSGASLSQVVEDAQNLSADSLANWDYYAGFISAY